MQHIIIYILNIENTVKKMSVKDLRKYIFQNYYEQITKEKLLIIEKEANCKKKRRKELIILTNKLTLSDPMGRIISPSYKKYHNF